MILGATTHTVTRYATGTWTSGVYTAGTASTFTIRGSVQPMDGRTLDLLPEGARSEARYILLCDHRQTELLEQDRVSVGSRSYLVMMLADWTAHTPLPYRGYVLGEVTSV
jgi:hypothetical protein